MFDPWVTLLSKKKSEKTFTSGYYWVLLGYYWGVLWGYYWGTTGVLLGYYWGYYWGSTEAVLVQY